MKSMWMVALCASLLGSALAHADTIRFPEEELAPESVLPVFDQPTSTKLRAISQAKRVEVAIGGSYNMTEPFFNPLGFGGEVAYHWSEESAVELNVGAYSGKPRSYDQQINQQTQLTTPPNIQNAPAPKYLVLGSYQYTPFYGKLSVTKNYVMHMHLFGTVGLGGYKIGETLYPAFAFGLGPQFDFTRNWSIKLDLRMLIHQGPDLFGNGTVKTAGSTGEVPSSDFSKKTFYDTLLAFNVVYLVP